MQTNKRNQIKWAPFNSVVNTKDVLKESTKNKITMPSLSEEQKQTIEKKLINAFYENSNITIDYYYNEMKNTLYGKIKKIDFIYHKIYFNNTILLFDQIINVK